MGRSNIAVPSIYKEVHDLVENIFLKGEQIWSYNPPACRQHLNSSVIQNVFSIIIEKRSLRQCFHIVTNSIEKITLTEQALLNNYWDTKQEKIVFPPTIWIFIWFKGEQMNQPHQAYFNIMEDSRFLLWTVGNTPYCTGFFQFSSLKYQVWWTGFFPSLKYQVPKFQFRNPFHWIKNVISK